MIIWSIGILLFGWVSVASAEFVDPVKFQDCVVVDERDVFTDKETIWVTCSVTPNGIVGLTYFYRDKQYTLAMERPFIPAIYGEGMEVKMRVDKGRVYILRGKVVQLKPTRVILSESSFGDYFFPFMDEVAAGKKAYIQIERGGEPFSVSLRGAAEAFQEFKQRTGKD